VFANAIELQRYLKLLPTTTATRDKKHNKKDGGDLNDAPETINLVVTNEPNLSTAELEGCRFEFALQVGRTLLEWRESSLVCPRPIEDTTPFAVIRVPYYTYTSYKPVTERDNRLFKVSIRFVLVHYDHLSNIPFNNKLCEMIEYWNVNEKYDPMKKNSHHFVGAALEALKVRIFGIGFRQEPSPVGTV